MPWVFGQDLCKYSDLGGVGWFRPTEGSRGKRVKKTLWPTFILLGHTKNKPAFGKALTGIIYAHEHINRLYGLHLLFFSMYQETFKAAMPSKASKTWVPLQKYGRLDSIKSSGKEKANRGHR